MRRRRGPSNVLLRLELLKRHRCRLKPFVARPRRQRVREIFVCYCVLLDSKAPLTGRCCRGWRGVAVGAALPEGTRACIIRVSMPHTIRLCLPSFRHGAAQQKCGSLPVRCFAACALPAAPLLRRHLLPLSPGYPHARVSFAVVGANMHHSTSCSDVNLSSWTESARASRLPASADHHACSAPPALLALPLGQCRCPFSLPCSCRAGPEVRGLPGPPVWLQDRLLL